MGKAIQQIPHEFMQQLVEYDWPGNVRELSNIIERATILTSGDAFQGEVPATERMASSSKSLSEFERDQILLVLQQTGWRIRGAGGAPERLLASNRPDRIEDRGENQQQRQAARSDRRSEINDYMNDTPIRDFWSNHPVWGAWAVTRPFRRAAWSGVTGWVDYGWTEPVPYSYGENVYYDNGDVYYGDDAVATEEEYAMQAEDIVASAPELPAEESQWMPLGVFALTRDGQSSGPAPTLFLQLVISKEGILAGTLHDTKTDTSQTIEGMVDKESQRTAWNVVGKPRPIMETGIYNLTQDTAPSLAHFADGTTQQVLMVRLEDPQGQQQ